MKASRRPVVKRPNMRKAVFLFPSGLTLLNLFFGVFAIIAAARLEFTTAGVYVVIGGICDALDGRVARATNAGTQFGEELDSLVDAITFGLAPGMIMYFAVLNRGGWDWVWVFAFAAAAVLRLARFNIEQAGTAKTYFQGLPSPAAGITLASYYWFSQSWLYSYGVVANLKWHFVLRMLMAVLAALMISNVPYPTFPRTGFRSLRAIGASVIVFGAFALLLTGKLEYFFPIAVLYVAFGLIRWLLAGLFERRQPTIPYDLSEGEDEEEEDEFEVPVSTVHAARPHRQAEPAPRPERGRGRGERAESPERAARAEREPRAPRAEVAARTDAEPARADRPQRTEAERAARREKREKRDQKRSKREERGERQPRAATADTVAPAEVTGATEPEVIAAPAAEETIVGVIPGGAESEAGATAGPVRKRKRRRRRGARDRGEAGAPGEAGGEGSLFDDEGGDDESESRSPYAAPAPAPVPEHPAPAQLPPHSSAVDAQPPAARPYTPPLPAPERTAPAPEAPAPVTPPTPSSSEPSE